MLQQACEPADDGEPEPHSGVRPAAARLVHLVELFEDARLQRERDADAGVDHVDGDVRACTPGAYQHAAAVRVADRVGNEVSYDALEERGVASYGKAGFAH